MTALEKREDTEANGGLLRAENATDGGDDAALRSPLSLRESIFSGSPNVPRTMLFTFLANLTSSVWQVTVWSPLLKALFSTNLQLGFVAAASGIGELAAAMVSGWGADRLGKERFLRVAAVVGMLSSVCVAAGVYWGHFATLMIASFMSGAAFGAYFPAVEGIFADSVPAGQRTFIYNVKFGLENTSYVLAYAVTMCLFAGMGDSWRVSTMKVVIYAGVGASFFVSLLLFTIRERYTLPSMACGSGSGEDDDEGDAATRALLVNDDGGDGGPDGVDTEEAQAAAAVEEAAQYKRVMAVLAQHAPGLIPQRFAPLAVAVKDVVLYFGSGMTMMYFSLFLIDDYHVSPIALQGVYMVGSVLSVALSQITAAIAGDSGKCATPDGKPRVNRIRAMLVPLGTGVAGIFYLALVKTGPMASLWPILVVFTIRSGSLSGIRGLSRSVLMDMVPAQNRSKWNVFESIASASWAGSAIVGGAIADRWDYRASFLITGAFHALSWLITASAAMNRDRPPTEVLETLVDAGVVSERERDDALKSHSDS